MKKISILLLCVFSMSVLAGHDEAKSAFLNDEAIKTTMDDWKVGDHQHVDALPNSVLISRLCGFAGCDEVYFVTLGVHYNPGFNPKSSVIAAKVKLSPGFPAKVEQLDTWKIFKE